jgi:nucleoid-associated protein YgaU
MNDTAKGVVEMTADAKVGLLLGLIFIVMIAFLVNGLPNFLQTANAEDAAVEVSITIPSPDEDLVIDDGVVQRAGDLQRNDIPLRQVPAPQEVINLDNPQARVHEPAIERPVTPMEPVQPVRSTVQTHVVKSGDNLALIAQKYYGKEEGNRRVVIDALFKANKSVVPSPDKIRVGQKLTIPPLDTLMTRSVQPAPVAQQTETRTTFREHLSSLFERSDRESRETSRVRIHVVKNGESLWGIAESTLGDGQRYKEILKINKAIKDADDVVVGMRLKIPNL